MVSFKHSDRPFWQRNSQTIILSVLELENIINIDLFVERKSGTKLDLVILMDAHSIHFIHKLELLLRVIVKSSRLAKSVHVKIRKGLM